MTTSGGPGRPTAVVTGATGSIGRALARRLAADGHVVVLVARTATRLEAVAEEIRDAGGAAVALPVDLTHPSAAESLLGQVGGAGGGLDVLVHCAGRMTLGTVEDSDVETFEGELRANVLAPYAATRALLAPLRGAHGQVVFLNSSVGLTTRGGISQYAASHHAMRAVAGSLRDEVNGDGVRVLSVYLGRTAGDRQAALHAATGAPYRPEALIQPDDVAELVLATLRLPRTAEVTDVSVRPMLKPAP